MPSGPLRLQDDDFWGDPLRNRSEVVATIARDGFLGLLIDAPGRVSLNRRSSAPVVGFFARSLRADRTIQQERQMLIVAVREDTNELSIALALDAGKTPAPQHPPTGSDPGEGTTLNSFETDLRTMLGLPWEPARYRVAAMLREYVSNPVSVEFGRDTGDFQDPAVAEFLVAERERVIPPPPHPVYPPRGDAQPDSLPDSLPDYRRSDDMPAAPAARGIQMRAERVVVDRPGGACVLRGGFRLPLARRDRVDSASVGGDRPDVGDQGATGVIPIHLVITGSDAPGPWVVPLKVPVYRQLDPHPSEASGYFAIDLFRMPEFPRAPMTYFITAFSADVVSDVTTLAVVSERMVGA